MPSRISCSPERRSAIDTFLAIASVRVVREYASRVIPDESLHRILEAGRVTGSSQNRQEWKFYLVTRGTRLDTLAGSVYAPSNISGCQVAIGITTTARSTFDAARCAQDMILAAWNEGIGSCPNGVRQAELARRILGIPQEEELITILSLGYPRQPYTPEAGDIEGILGRIKRKPLDELVVRVGE